jgi:hypothetical protein
VRKKVKLYMRDMEDRDQKLLDDLDDPKVVDALLTLVRRTVRRVLASGKRTYQDAIQIQLALIIEIWLCAPLRLKNMRHLRLDRHFFIIDDRSLLGSGVVGGITAAASLSKVDSRCTLRLFQRACSRGA